MAGNAHSGRKTKSNEEYKLATIDECWKLVRENINNEALPLQFRVELAAKHTVKSIPTELSGGFTAQVVAMGTIVKDGQTAEFKIGTPFVAPEDPQHTG